MVREKEDKRWGDNIYNKKKKKLWINSYVIVTILIFHSSEQAKAKSFPIKKNLTYLDAKHLSH
jgi:hypothetical protein